MARERLGSRLGFIMLSAGCAIGCGNIWKFPWMVGENGGGIFVLIYLFCLLILGLPAMTMEFALGRASQKSVVRMYHTLEKPGQKWHYMGYVSLFGNLCLMAFYTVVAGWILYYFTQFLRGDYQELSFSSMIASPSVNMTFMTIVVALAFLILSFQIQNGLEKVTKYMMVLLLVLICVLAVKSGFGEGAKDGYRFYLLPDFSKLHFSTFVAAMNQAFFTLSIGVGSMAIFGSYIGKDHTLLGESLNVIILDTFVALVAGLIIFPSCATYNLPVSAGPSLLFDTMATVFRNMNGGRIWGTLFFLFMVFASFSTVLAVCENILACIRELTGWDRKKGCLASGLLVYVLSITTALGYSVFQFHPFGEGSAWLDLWDFLISTNILPLGCAVMAIFSTSTRFGWGWNNFVEEANMGEGLKVKPWMRPLFSYIVPVLILLIYILQFLL